MKRQFVIMGQFETDWKDIGLGDKELKDLQEYIIADPKAGDPMSGTGGVRKFRFALEGRGKSGGIRVCYLDVPLAEITYLITAYTKKEKDNLSMKERNDVKKLSDILTKQALTRRKDERL